MEFFKKSKNLENLYEIFILHKRKIPTFHIFPCTNTVDSWYLQCLGINWFSCYWEIYNKTLWYINQINIKRQSVKIQLTSPSIKKPSASKLLLLSLLRSNSEDFNMNCNNWWWKTKINCWGLKNGQYCNNWSFMGSYDTEGI